MEEDKKAEEVYRTFPERFGDLALEITSKWDLGKDTLPRILKGALETLRYCIENPEDPGVSWESPWIEAHYPVEWNWERGGIVTPFPETFPESIAETLRRGEDPFEKNPEEIRALAVKFLSQSGQVFFLQAVTHGIAVHIKDQKVAGFFFLDPEIKDELDALPEEEREKRLDHYREPFNLGGLPWMDEDGSRYILAPLEKGGGDFLPEEMRKALENVSLLNFEGEVNGVAHRGGVVFVIDPLRVDEDKKEVYFPVTVGLSIMPADFTLTTLAIQEEDSTGELKGYVPAAENLVPEVIPSTWPEADRKRLWESLLNELPQKVQELLDQDATGEEVEGLVPAAAVAPSPERRKTIGVAFGQAMYSGQAIELLRDMAGVHLPKKWTTLKKWEDLEREEVKAILDEEGDRAFQNLREKNKDARGPLLKRQFLSGGREEVKLTAEAAKRLRISHGTGRGFIDRNQYNEEVFSRLYQSPGGGYLEIGLSWEGMAGPITDEWRESKTKELEGELRKLKNSGGLFPGLNNEEIKKIERSLDRLKTWREGRLIMDAIYGQVGVQKRSTVEIPAEAFRVLLWPKKARTREWPTYWKKSIEDALYSLEKFTFTARTHELSKLYGHGALIAEWWYKEPELSGRVPRGYGSYFITVTPGALGCLRIFESGKIKLKSGGEVVCFDFSKKPTKDDKASLGWGDKDRTTKEYYVSKDAGGVFYNTAADLSPSQMNLYTFIERNITRKGDGSRDKAARVKNSREPRTYTSALCPLLEEGKEYQGALGHWDHNPESGFTLGGTENRKGRRPGGLLYHMGLRLPTGRRSKTSVIVKGLEDLHAVVEVYLGGVVVGNDGTGWIPLSSFLTLGEKKLLKNLSVFIFLPTDWRDQARRKWEETTDRRATEDPQEAERGLWDENVEEGIGGAVASEADGFRGWPLYRRLHAMMKARGLNQKQMAKIFGVSAPLVSNWMKGEKQSGRKIPERLHRLMEEWIERKKVPTAEELEASKKTPGG